jgi:hypothetical protein
VPLAELSKPADVVVQNIAITTRKPIIADHALHSVDYIIQRPLVIPVLYERRLKFSEFLFGFVESVLIAPDIAEHSGLNVIQIVPHAIEHSRPPLIPAIIIVPVPMIRVIVTRALGLHAGGQTKQHQTSTRDRS